MSFRCLLRLVLSLLLGVSFASASTVAVHDPSIVIAYVDGSGNSYPENDAGKTRTKRYYVFGTMLGAAWSTDMTNWTSFTPSMLLNGVVSTDYYQIFKNEGDYAAHTTTADLSGNLWAPDVIYNTAMKKWCMYFSLSGDAFKSSIILLTSDNIEGPYKKVGAVLYGGFTNATTSIGRTDYQNVIGTSSVAARYLTNGAWNNDYAASVIDPCVRYDESGKLWMSYGSWSGGIFLLKLDETTGLRSGSWNYGYSAPAWNGKRLRYDPYFGLHLAGGYYVSGEGSYIRYFQDPNGKNGYYYLFESMGFYSPEGGYTMRVFRSPSIDGVYTDATGDTATFAAYVLNYGNNVKYGFPILQNYKWSWWDMASVAQGHNSLLRDEDGRSYLIYHRKYDNGTAWHKVETHELFFNDQGWIVAAPFAHRPASGLRTSAVPLDEIVGSYGVITHRPVDYANLKSNGEESLELHADGSVSGAYKGTWNYAYSKGRQFLNLTTDSGTFRGVLADQLMEGKGTKTLAFTAMNPSNERALWGYRKPSFARTRTLHVHDHSAKIGNADTVTAWNAYDKFRRDTVSGDFEAEYAFVSTTAGAQNGYNWALAFKNSRGLWYLRADASSLSNFAGSNVGYKVDWNGTPDWKSAFKGKNVRLKVRRIGTTIDVFAWADTTLVETVTATETPTGTDTLYLGGENSILDLQSVSMRSLKVRTPIGGAGDDGTYTAAFNSLFTDTATVSGDFELRSRFVNQHSPESTNNWDNWILRELSGSKIMLLRSDAYALDAIGTVTFGVDWNWDKFLPFVSGAEVSMALRRTGTSVTCSTTVNGADGSTGHSVAVQVGAPATALSFGFTNEKSLVDLLELETVTRIGISSAGGTVGTNVRSLTPGLRLQTQGRLLILVASEAGTAQLMRANGRRALDISYQAGTNRYRLEAGLYLLGAHKILVP